MEDTRLVVFVPMEDEHVHNANDEYPECTNDPSCPCHQEAKEAAWHDLQNMYPVLGVPPVAA